MDILSAYWSREELLTNGLVLLHLLGAALVGMLLGYERSYHGRAAGMRTYALVCVASTMLTVINAYPSHWYGGLSATPSAADPTRVVQGIMTGIGFLGAGVIMKEGFNIRGLSTAASIWMTAAIGVVIGIGFYGAAICATLVGMAAMTSLGPLERLLPHHSTMKLSLIYAAAKAPSSDCIKEQMKMRGFEVVDWSFHYCQEKESFRFDLVLQALGRGDSRVLANDLSGSTDVLEFQLAPSRA